MKSTSVISASEAAAPKKPKREILTCDGPAAAGKSVLADVAKELDYFLLPTGSIYRALAYLVHQAGISPANRDAVTRLLKTEFPRLMLTSEGQILLDGRILGDLELRKLAVTQIVSSVSEIPMVRELVLPLQRDFAGGRRIVAEGRDLGSVVFRDTANLKVYLTASPEERARRRHKQYENDPDKKGVTYEQTLDEINRRDRMDSSRECCPLIVPHGAHVVDSTAMSKAEVCQMILGLWRKYAL